MRRKGIQLAYPFEEKRLAKWEPPYLVQPKLDGERCRAIFSAEAPLRVDWESGGNPNYTGSSVTLLSSEGNVIVSVPHINQALKDMHLPDGTELDGELYVKGMNFEDVHSIVGRTVNLHPDHGNMQYHIFDSINKWSQIVRSTRLINLLADVGRDSPIRRVCTLPVNSFDEVMRIYDGFIKDGYEGMIVRHKDAPYIRRRSTFMMKFKPKKSDIYKVVGWKEEISIKGVPKQRMGALICESEDTMNEFSVGSGMDSDTRELLWTMKEQLPGKHCKVEYQHITSGKGVPRFPIFLKIFDPDDAPWSN